MVAKITVKKSMRWGIFAVFMIMPLVANATVSATVDYIFDGDTFAGRVQIAPDIEIDARIRIRNVDTPEIHGECDSEIAAALRAKERLVALIPVNSVVVLDNIKDDKYLGRIDANVSNASGLDVGSVLIKEGLGRLYDGGHRASWCK